MMNRRDFLIGAASAATAAAAPARRPNILLLFPDQHRFDWTGANADLPLRTPNLDALARRGMRFTRSVVASPLCAPSRACLAAGKEYDRCRVPVPRDMDSRSLRPLLEGRTKRHRDCVLSGLGKWRMAWDGRYKLITGFGEGPLLFDLEGDPLENENLAGREPGQVERLMPLLKAG